MDIKVVILSLFFFYFTQGNHIGQTSDILTLAAQSAEVSRMNMVIGQLEKTNFYLTLFQSPKQTQKKKKMSYLPLGSNYSVTTIFVNPPVKKKTNGTWYFVLRTVTFKVENMSVLSETSQITWHYNWYLKIRNSDP